MELVSCQFIEMPTYGACFVENYEIIIIMHECCRKVKTSFFLLWIAVILFFIIDLHFSVTMNGTGLTKLYSLLLKIVTDPKCLVLVMISLSSVQLVILI